MVEDLQIEEERDNSRVRDEGSAGLLREAQHFTLR